MRLTPTSPPTFAQQIADAKQVIDASTAPDALNSHGRVKTSAFKAMLKAIKNVNTFMYRFDPSDRKTIANVKHIKEALHGLRVTHRLHEPMLFVSKFERVENLQVKFTRLFGGTAYESPVNRRMPAYQMELAKLRDAVGRLTVYLDDPASSQAACVAALSGTRHS